MNHEQFLKYIEDKRASIQAELKEGDGLSTTAIQQLKEQLEMLESARKIMTYGTGPERRRFRRDYCRRLGL